jgi:hypothetical protein
MSQHRQKSSLAMALACAALLLLSSCAGSGEGVGEGGSPNNPGGPPPGDGSSTTSFRNIQESIFKPSCVCHVGAAAPQGLVLSTDSTLDLLVNKPSGEMPDLSRVEPGNPDDSYLIRKLEGGPDIVGFQMPPTELGETHLAQEQINLIRQWIADGALDN